MTNPSCPRCGRVFSEWQPVHLTCLLHRLRYFIIALVVIMSLCAVAVLNILQAEQITVLAAKPSLEEAADGQGAPDDAAAAVAVAPTATPTVIPIASPTPEQPTSTYTPEILTPILSPSPEVEGTINTGTLNLRAGPGVEYPSLAKLDDGAKFIVIGKNGDWLQVQAPGGLTGWLNGKYAIITGLLDTVAEVAAPETTPTLPTPEPQPTALPPTPEPQPTALPQPIPSPTPVPPPKPNLLATNRGDFLNGQGVGGWKYLSNVGR